MGIFSHFREKRRARAVLEHPIPDDAWDWAIKEHPIFGNLSKEERARLRWLATAFLAEKTFDPVDGVKLDEGLRVSVAAQACLPLVAMPEGLEWYREFSTIIVTPKEYKVTKYDYDEAGVVHEYDDEFSGEAFDLGPVALSRLDIEDSGWGDGYNVVIHEMAHKLDALWGDIDGAPPLRAGMSASEWKRVFRAAFDGFKARLAEAESRQATRGRRRKGKLRAPSGPKLDSYAAESPSEFFAVACEQFFEKPETLREEFPDVYAQLAKFFGRDPAATGETRAQGR